MDVILHLGGHRCGTTTLQHYLTRNAVALGDAGVVSWTPKRTRAGLFTGLIQRPAAITPQIARRGMRSCGLMAMEIDQLDQAGYRDLIISDENMIGTIRANLSDAELYPEAIQRLARFRAGTGDAPRRIGLCVRAYDRLWASALSYQIGKGYGVPDTEYINALTHQPRRWRHLIGDIASVFPRSDIMVWPFERYVGQPDTQLGLLTGGLHFHSALDATRDWLNRSPDRPTLRAELETREETTTLPFNGIGRWSPFTEGQKQKLRDDYADDIAWLRAGADGMASLYEGHFHDPTGSGPDTIKTSGFTAFDRDRGHSHDHEQILG